MKRKNIIVTFLSFIIGIITGCLIMFFVMKNNNITLEETKESPYTLEEIYELVEQPEKFNKLLNNYDEQGIAYTIFHFYDYFNKSTPLKTVKLKTKIVDNKEVLAKENDKYIIESISYIDHYEFSKKMDSFLEDEKKVKDLCKEEKEKNCNYAYSSIVKYLIYGELGL